LNGTISKQKKGKKPTWKTTATGSGIVSEKKGKLVGKNKVTGTYSDTFEGQGPFKGTFVLNRVPN
jgi:hypothetical protein